MRKQTDRSERDALVGRMQLALSYYQDPAPSPSLGTKRVTKWILPVMCAAEDGIPGTVDRGSCPSCTRHRFFATLSLERRQRQVNLAHISASAPGRDCRLELERRA